MTGVAEIQDRIKMLMLERAEKARTLRDAGGRGVELAERIDQLDKWIAQLDGAVLLACPNCNGTEELADVTNYPGLCGGSFIRLSDGDIDFEGNGSTEIIWDAGATPDENVQCDSCGWVGKREQLVPYQDEDEDEDEPECEDCQVNGEDCETHGEAAKAARAAVYADPKRTLELLRAAGLAE